MMMGFDSFNLKSNCFLQKSFIPVDTSHHLRMLPPITKTKICLLTAEEIASNEHTRCISAGITVTERLDV